MTEIFEFLDELNKYSSLILMFATLVYVYFTYKLTKETTKLREVETTPFMSIYIKPTFLIELVIENIGKAPAYDIKFEMDSKYSKCFSCSCDFKNKISYFSPSQQLFVMMKPYEELEKFDFTSIQLKVIYLSKDGRKFEEMFNIEWKYLAGSPIETNKLNDIKKEIEKSTKEIKNLVKTIKDKEYLITNKLKILEFSKEDDELYIIFSNGYIEMISFNDFSQKTNIKIEEIDKLNLSNGSIINYSNRLTYLAEEIYDKLTKRANNLNNGYHEVENET